MQKYNFRFAVGAILTFAVWTSVLAQSRGFDVTRMDKSVEACADFFQYANGTWLKNTEIPAAYSRWGSFNILGENNNAVLKDILENAEKNGGAKNSDAQLIGDYYASCMDEAAIEKAGIAPLKPTFAQIEKIKDAKDVQKEIAVFHAQGVPALFGFGGGPDLKNSSAVIVNEPFQTFGRLARPSRGERQNRDDGSNSVGERFQTAGRTARPGKSLS